MKQILIAAALLIGFTAQNSPAANGFTVLRVSTPLIASASAGLKLGQPSGEMRPAMQAEAGIGGGRIALGLDNTGEAGFGYAFKAAVLRTWIEPLGVDEDQSFLGIELELSVKQLVLSAGGYRRVSQGDDDWLGTLGLGLIF